MNYNNIKEIKNLQNKNNEYLTTINILENNYTNIIDRYHSKILSNDMQNTIDIVTVVNNYKIYNRCVGNNKFIKHRKNIKINIIDNTKDNIFITKRYNNFISQHKENNWILFCHCDWEILEDIIPHLDNLDKESIYGPIGSKYEIINKSNDILYVTRNTIGSCLERRRDGSGLRRLGDTNSYLNLTDTFDCQALLVHSSLIQKYNLKFDENLPWDLYVEDFCISSLLNHNIKSYTVNINCCHWSGYHITPKSYFKSLEYINSKYKNHLFAGTVSMIGMIPHIEISVKEKIFRDLRKKFMTQL